MKQNYELLDQTSDLRIRIFGNGVEDIVFNSIKAFNEIVYEGQVRKYKKMQKYELHFDKEELILVNIFSWLILQLDSFNILVNPVEINENKEKGVMTITFTKVIPLSVNSFNFVPKGATYNEVIFNIEKGYSEITIDT